MVRRALRLYLTLAWQLGVAAKEHPGAEFHIVSKDQDFDPLIAHLAGRGTRVARHEAFADLPFLVPPKKSTLSEPPFPVAKAVPKAAVPRKPKPAAD